MFEPERLPPRDADGFTAHPDLPEWGENEPGSPILAALGFDSRFVLMENDGSDEVNDEYFERGGSYAGWTPTSPGDGWVLAGVWDTEDGPQACFVRPNDGLSGPSERSE